MYKGKWDLKILIYFVVVDCLFKIDCFKQLLLRFIKLIGVYLLLKLNMKKKYKKGRKRGDRKRKKRSIGKRGKRKKGRK